MLLNYYTVKKTGSHEIIIQKSKFIGYTKRVKSEEEAQDFILAIKKKHYDATHNCSAYMIGAQNNIQKANDDGEPSGTAGVPMLEVLKKMQLKDTVIVVTRYFGGIKLGAGGLIRAYGGVTSETLKAIGIVKCSLMQGFSVQIDYPLLGRVENYIRNETYLLETINYLATVELIVYVSNVDILDFKTAIVNLTSNQVLMNEIETKYVETDAELP